MGMERAGKVSVRVAPLPLPRLTVHAAAAVEFASWCCDKCRQSAWDGVQWGLIKRIRMYGVDSEDITRMAIDMTFSPDSEGSVTIDTGDGKTMLEALDAGLWRALSSALRDMRRRGLKPTARYRYHDHIEADPVLKAEAMARLGMKPTPVGPWPDGCEPKQVLGIKPGKDKGLAFNFFIAGRKE